MPRGRKPRPKTFEDLIRQYDDEIAKLKEEIEIVKLKKNRTIIAHEREEGQKLYEFIKSRGKTVDEVIEELSQKES